MSGRGFYWLIDLWEGIDVLWTCLVQVGEVYAHPPSPIGLFYQDHIGDPIGVLTLSNESRLK